MLGRFDQIISYFIFVVVIFIAMTVVALFVLRRKEGRRPAYSTPGYPFTPVAFLLMVVLLLLLLGSNNPGQSFLGVAVVALGIPVYYAFFHRRFVESQK